MIQEIFKECKSAEDRYKKIIELGRNLPDMPEELRRDENIVSGCQSVMYLHLAVVDGKVFFSASSDALISKGLAAILIQFYNGMTPQEVVQNKPFFLEDLQIPASLSPTRSNGLANMILRMQQEAIKFITK